LILILGFWVACICWFAQLFLCSPVGPFGGGQAATLGGGGWDSITLRHNAVHALAQGQWLGRCKTGRRCGRVRRAGMLTILRRRVAPRAAAWRLPASVAAARSRLWAMAAHNTQAELAPKCPEGNAGQRSVDQVGEGGFDDGVAAVGDIGVGERLV